MTRRRPLDQRELPSDADLERFGDTFRHCPHCNRAIYDQAEICPKCGFAILPERRAGRPWVFFVLVLLIAILVLLSLQGFRFVPGP